MTSVFRMQIVDTRTGELVQFEPGRVVEIDFLQDCVDRIISKGVGFGRTEAHVRADIVAGLSEAVLALKSKVQP